MSAPAACATSQIVTLPVIPELYNPDFLDVLVPRREVVEVKASSEPVPTNPMMEALKATSYHTFTTNGAPAFSSTFSATLDAFNGLRPGADGSRIHTLLQRSWAEDPVLTLRLIWNLRSIHDGKGEKELFYQAWGWLYQKHPRTALENLPRLVEPLCRIGKKAEAPHGYWKDLLNILCLAALNQLGPLDETPSFLSYPRGKRVPVWKRPRKCRRGAPLSEEAREQKLAQVKAFNDSVKAKARATRVRNASHLHSGLVKKLSDPKFRALYILVARLFAHKLATDVHVLEQFEASKDKEERRTISFQFSLAGKWAPTPGCSHDRHTNIATAIAALLHHTQSLGTPRVVVTPENETSELDTHILRSFYQRWVLSPLRKATELPEPLMSAKRWTEIKYSRVASKCMQANMERFFTHDPIGFEKFLEGVESGKKKISGATLMPHQLLKDLLLTTHDLSESTRKESKKADIQRQIAEIKTRGIQAQWKTMVDRLRESGKLENSLAICDVSGSMGTINDVDEDSKYVSPILPAVSLSLVLAQLATPPFSNGFITFSANPEFVQLDPSLSLADTVHAMVRSSWGMNTNLEAVFLKLLLPLAVQNKVKPEDMVKRLFIFSDMQFDTSLTPYHGYSYSSEPINWETSHDVIEKAFKEAGYEMPEIVYWNLAMQYGTVPVTHDRKGVAIMSGFSASMMKVFLGEEEEEIVEEGWEDIKPEVEPKKEKEPESFDPMSVMKKVLSKRSYLGLVVVD